MKRITADIKGYIKTIVDLEERIKWASTPPVTIPDMKYPVSSLKGASEHAFFSLITRNLP